MEGLPQVRFAYADPPYLGCCRLYGHFHPDGRCWDDIETHEALIDRLMYEYPNGWALSCTSNSLVPLMADRRFDFRIGAWVKPFHAYKRNVRPAYSWEPVVFHGGRNPSAGYRHAPPEKGGKATTPKDFVSANIMLRKGLTGAKPPAFCEWVLQLLNAQPGDTVFDLFPGTGMFGDVARELGIEVGEIGAEDVA